MTVHKSHPFPHWLYNDKWEMALQRNKAVAEERIVKHIEAAGGFIESAEVRHSRAFGRVLAARRIFVIAFNRGTSSGAYKRNFEIFQPDFKGKAYACSSRTAVVRLLQTALLPYKDSQTQKSVRAFLRGITSEAEAIAVVWKLGEDFEKKTANSLRLSIRKQSISLDGFYEGKRVEASS